MTDSYLVLFDADRIKDYVFATGRLKEIRGASEQIRRLTDYHDQYQAETFRQYGLSRWQRGASEGVIYASGGAGAVLFASQERASSFCADLERAMRWQTGSATLSAVWQPVTYGTAGTPVVAEAAAQRLAAQKLARRKASRPQAELIPSGGTIRFCGSDRLRPANVRIREVEGESLFASEATANKRLHNRRYRNQETVIQSPAWQAFERQLTQRGQAESIADWRGAINPSQDLGDIAGLACPEGYVALVYGDGDRIGAAIRTTVEAYGFYGYQLFSEALAYGAADATALALANAYGGHAPRKGKQALPFEIITVGGDDIILICTAEHGLSLAYDLASHFGDLVGAYLEDTPDPIALAEPITMSVGTIIAHDSVPITQLERRGRELLKSAKKVAGGGVDFHIVSTPGLDALTAIRRRSYAFGQDTGLTSRPCSRETIQQMLAQARYLCGLSDKDGTPASALDTIMKAQLLGMPASKRADLYRACFADRVQATLDVLTVQMRMRRREREALMQAMFALGYGSFYPFTSDPDHQPPYYTALIDLLEVMEFVAEEGQWGPSSVLS